MKCIYKVKFNNFYQLVEKICWISNIKNTKSVFSKQMYGNIKLTFLVAYKEKINVSYRRFVKICEENFIQPMLCLKKIPHYTTLQKFVARTPKQLFEKLVKACRKLLNLKNLEDLTLHSLINDLSPLEKINNLETITLDIDSQQYFDKFSELKIDLKGISLNDSIDSDLKELNLSKLNNFKNLEDLTLSIDKFSNFDSIKNLSGLKKFSFYSYVFDDLHEGYFSWDISPLKKLETLRITYYPFAHGYGLNKIKNLESLSNLKNMHISSGILFEQCVSFKENNPNINIRCSR
jgi:hypothetical protein